MSFVLTDDELALLRYTCDLFFVEESPLFFLEVDPREPADYEGSYRSLVQKGIVDPAGFRITDDALNRIAPITECDARLVYLAQEDGVMRERDFYMLDEIAVPYKHAEEGHLLGQDHDQEELLDHLARRMMPRRSGGDRLDVTFSAIEYLALCRLGQPLPSEGSSVTLERAEARERLGAAPPPRALEGLSPSRLSVLAGARQAPPKLTGEGLIGVDVWDAAVEGLIQRGLVSAEGGRLDLRAALTDALRALGSSARHTFVRYDFGEDEWFIRETSFLACEGSLFFLGAVPGEDGLLRLSELDGDGLKDALAMAVGPLRRAEDAPRQRPFRAARIGSEEDLERDTELNLETIGAQRISSAD